jgi:M6 family metalloprotease-like protein
VRRRRRIVVLLVCCACASAAHAPAASQAVTRETQIVRPPITRGDLGGSGLPIGRLPCGVAGTLNGGYRFRKGDGTLRAAMVFVDFSDAPADPDWTTDDLYRGFVPQSQSAFTSLSRGKFVLRVTPTPGWARMPKPLSAYGFGDGNSVDVDSYYAYVRDAVRAADPAFDFSRYSAVYVVPPPGAQTPYASGPGEEPGEEFEADGRKIPYSAVLRTTDDSDRLYTGLVHETGHMLGLDDLYDVEGDRDFAGSWDVMHSSDGPDAPMTTWTRFLVGWLDKPDFRCLTRSATKTLTPADRPGGLKAIVIKTGPVTAYVVEARTDGNPDGCRRDGVLVYRVRTDVEYGTGPLRVAPSRGEPPEDCGDNGHATFVPGEPGFRARDRGFNVRVLERRGDTFRVRVRFSRRGATR